jgi:hypothetical protein
MIRNFGRYPHRNEALGRETTPEEKQFLESEPHLPGTGSMSVGPVPPDAVED